jgi:carbon storage regulator
LPWVDTAAVAADIVACDAKRRVERTKSLAGGRTPEIQPQLSIGSVRLADRSIHEEGATMLVLSRHRDESIIIGDDIVVTIVDIRGDKVRLGINAPQDVPVHRQEVYEAIQRENRKASQVRPSETRELGK